MKADSLGDRMKEYYEKRSRRYLTRRTPVIMRIDGKAFHTFTRGCTKPFDKRTMGAMVYTAMDLMEKMQGTKIAYVQSDEISILFTDYDRLETDAWFNYNIQKMCSVSASIAAVSFTLAYAGEETHLCDVDPAYFDSRVFNIPKEEVINYFRWRYQDWQRNSIQMLAQAHFSHAELQNKNKGDLHEMLLQQKSINWNDLDIICKNGTLIIGSETFFDFNLMTEKWKNKVEELVWREES